MNISVNSQLLAQELRLLSRIVAAKPTLPILTHVLFRAEPMGDRLYMYATDLELGLSTSCKAIVHDPGTFSLSAKTLMALVEQFPNADVHMTEEKSQVHIRSGAFKSRLQTFTATDFPAQPEVTGEVANLPVATFQTLIAKTRYAISEKVGKYLMDGALLALAPAMAAMVATDAKRLAVATMAYTGPERQTIIPSKTLDVIATLDGESVAFSVGPNHLFFGYGERLLTSRMLDGTFPNYGRIIPRENDKQVTVGRTALAAALRRIMSISGESQTVYIAFDPQRITLTAQTADIGDADEQIMVVYAGAPIKVCLNGKFVLDFLDAAVNPTVGLALRDADAPLLLTDGDSFINVVVLIRT